MSEGQLKAFLEAVKADAGLLEKLKAAADLDAAVAIAKDAGYEVTKAEWLKAQAKKTLELSDEELEAVGGGATPLVTMTVVEVVTVGATIATAVSILSGCEW